MPVQPLSFFYPLGTRLIALPNWTSPRLLFEADPWTSRWSASRFLDAYSWMGHVRRNLHRCAALVLPSRRLASGAGAPPLVRFVTEAGVAFRRSVVLVGRADHRQKYTMICLGDDDRPVAYVKYGEKEAAKKQVVHEAGVLRMLPTQWGPEFVCASEVGVGFALLMRPVDGQAITKSPLTAASQNAVLRWVRFGGSGERACAEAHPAIAGREWPKELQFSLETLSGNKLPVGWQHGDLTPWNIRIQPSGAVQAIDWEDARQDGCPWFDVVYYVMQVHYHLMGSGIENAYRDAINWLSAAGCEAAMADAVMRLAVCDAWLRWRASGWPDEHPSQRFRQAIWSKKP